MTIVTPSLTPQPPMEPATGTAMDYLIPIAFFLVLILVGVIIFLVTERFAEGLSPDDLPGD